jgi:hypothetical protein
MAETDATDFAKVGLSVGEDNACRFGIAAQVDD